MSRTFKDRPYWVLKNDPKMARYAVHNHLAPQRKLVGEEEYNIYQWHPRGHELTPVYRTRKMFKHWTEPVPCTLDIPEVNDAYHGRWQGSTPNEEMLNRKYCEYYLEYYPNIHSNKSAKHTVNKSARGKVRQQCKNLASKYDRVIDCREELEWFGDFSLEDIWEAQGIDSADWDVYAETKRHKDYKIWYDG